jgi:hypothetical protein
VCPHVATLILHSQLCVGGGWLLRGGLLALLDDHSNTLNRFQSYPSSPPVISITWDNQTRTYLRISFALAYENERMRWIAQIGPNFKSKLLLHPLAIAILTNCYWKTSFISSTRVASDQDILMLPDQEYCSDIYQDVARHISGATGTDDSRSVRLFSSLPRVQMY